MKRAITILTVILGIAVSLHAQKEAVFCKGRCYKGYIFDTSYLIFKSVKQQQSRALLSGNEIEKAENILKNNLVALNANKINQTDGCPNISKKLRKYHRQYFGFINSKGEKIVWINMFWDKKFNNKSKYELISVNDGCSYYWNIEVNITTSTLSNLQINGKG